MVEATVSCGQHIDVTNSYVAFTPLWLDKRAKLACTFTMHTTVKILNIGTYMSEQTV